MADYTLYYWPIPFRGQFVRSVLAHVHAEWDEKTFEEIQAMRCASPDEQPVPHVGPPVLIDRAADVSIAQTEAILTYLGRKHELIPGDLVLEAFTHKVIADANDVLYEMTRYNGAQMWSDATWADYQPRLTRWMQIFEDTGRRFGLTPESGSLLGTAEIGIADLTAHILWGTMTTCFPTLRAVLDDNAPALAGLSDRIGALPDQAELQRKSNGNEWCSGQIEASLREVLS